MLLPVRTLPEWADFKAARGPIYRQR
jgi:hypothetical protein